MSVFGDPLLQGRRSKGLTGSEWHNCSTGGANDQRTCGLLSERWLRWNLLPCSYRERWQKGPASGSLMGSPDKQALMVLDGGGQSTISSADVLKPQAWGTSSCFQNAATERLRHKWDNVPKRQAQWPERKILGAIWTTFISQQCELTMVRVYCKCSVFAMCVCLCGYGVMTLGADKPWRVTVIKNKSSHPHLREAPQCRLHLPNTWPVLNPELESLNNTQTHTLQTLHKTHCSRTAGTLKPADQAWR